MAERSSLRGSRLGSTSYEDERGVEFAARQEISYDCPRKHRFSVMFAEEAEIPALWECPRCGAEALRVETDRPEAKPTKPARTHWDMLRERRSIADLEELLAERLQLLRAGALVEPSRPVAEERPSRRRKSA